MNKLKLKPHNQKTYEEVKEFLKTGNRCAIFNTCGSGKSYVLYRLMQDFENKNIILLTPLESIQTQYDDNSYIDFENVKNITYQLLNTRYKDKMLENEFNNIDLIIADELQHTGAPKWGEAFKALLKLFPNAKVVGASATPWRFLEERNMVEELFHGKYAGNIDLKTAVNNGILPKPTIVNAFYNIDEVVKPLRKKVFNCTLDEIKKLELYDQIDNLSILWKNTYNIDHIIREHFSIPFIEQNGLKLIVFCKNIKELSSAKNELVEQFEKVFNNTKVYSSTVYYKYPESKQRLKDFRNVKKNNSIHLLFTIDKLNEGVHIKDVDGVIMIRKTMSPNVYIQQMARCLEVGKDYSPIILDLINNSNNDFAKNCWKDIYGNEKIYDMSQYDKEINSELNPFIQLGFFDYISDFNKIIYNINKLYSFTWDHWTSEEDEILKTYYPLEGITKLLKRLPNRTFGGIKRRIQVLNLEPIRLFWSLEEDEILKKYYHNDSIEELSKKLPNRNRHAIRTRAIKLKLTTSKKWTSEEEDILKKYYNPNSTIQLLLDMLPNRTSWAIYNKLKKLGLSDNISYNAWTPEEDEILKKYYKKEFKKILKRLPNRTKDGVAKRVEFLNLQTKNWSPKWTSEEDEILKTYYPLEGIKVINRLSNRDENSIRNQTQKLKIKVNDRSPNWTPEEDEIIKKYYKNGMKTLMLYLPNRTYSATTYRIDVLGIKSNMKHWTFEEEEIVKKYYYTEGRQGIHKRLSNRTLSAITAKIKKLNLKKENRK